VKLSRRDEYKQNLKLNPVSVTDLEESSYTGFGCDVLEPGCSLATSLLLNTKPE